MSIREDKLMNNKIICNAVPAYSEAPVSPGLLDEKYEQILSELKIYNDDQIIFVIPKGYNFIKYKDKYTIIEAKDESGFTYLNNSAIAKVLSGEKAIPSEKNISSQDKNIYTIEELLNSEFKIVYIYGCGAENINI